MSEDQDLPQEQKEDHSGFDELSAYINPIDGSGQVEMDIEAKSKDGPKRKFLDPQYLWDKCKEYFDRCDSQGYSYTIPDLAFYLGFISRQALFHYLKRGDNCSKVIRAARLKIEAQRNRQVVDGQGHVAGRIFDLKCNFGYNEMGQDEGGNFEGAQPQMNVQQNFYGLPPQPATLEEWTQQYQKLMQGQQKSQLATQTEQSDDASVIDVGHSIEDALNDE